MRFTLRDSTEPIYPMLLMALILPLHNLATDGVYPTLLLPVKYVSSYLTFSPFPRFSTRRSSFCDTFPRIFFKNTESPFNDHPALCSSDFPPNAGESVRTNQHQAIFRHQFQRTKNLTSTIRIRVALVTPFI